MKKLFVLFILVLLVGALTLSAQEEEKKINVFGGLGFAASDLEGLCIDIGAELQLTGNIYGQLMFDYYPNPGGGDVGVDMSGYGVNLYGVYKIPSSDTMSFFLKGGVHYTSLKATSSGYGYSISLTESFFGIGGGGGIEYALNEKFSIYGGGTVKLMFDSGDTAKWFKFYCGVSYNIR